MIEHRGPEARVRRGLEDAVATVRRLPALIDAVERLAEQARVGIRLHPDTRRAQVSRRTATVAMALAVTALAVALFALAG